MKKFGNQWFLGTVDELQDDEGTQLWHVTYQDFDGEDLTRAELTAVLAYHPLLNTEGDLEPPELGSFVWFSQSGHPRLGMVTTIDPTVSRPVIVQLHEPKKGSSPLYAARFRAATQEGNDEPQLARITLHQIMLKVKTLSARGYLTAADRNRLRQRLSV